MTDLKFELLGILYPANSTDPVRKLQLLQSGLASPVEVEKALVDLGRQGYVTSAVGSDIVTLTTAGRTAFEGAQISRKKQTDDKKDQEGCDHQDESLHCHTDFRYGRSDDN